jgi:hypothetical protein
MDINEIREGMTAIEEGTVITRADRLMMLIIESNLLLHDQNEEIIKMKKENNANRERRDKINKILKRNKLAQV